MRILVCGLPGTGKTTFAKELLSQLGEEACLFNADDVRNMYDDWDFSMEGRIRQAERMRRLANDSGFKYAICDFVAPTEEIRNIFSPDYTIWMDTEEKSEYEDTNKLFERPSLWDYIVKVKDVTNTVNSCVEQIHELAQNHDRQSAVEQVNTSDICL